jgi:hypothetical protein
MGNQNDFDNITECGPSQMSNGEVMTVDSDTVSGKKGRNGIIARLDHCFTIAKYAIVDGLDGNQVHWHRYFSYLRS